MADLVNLHCSACLENKSLVRILKCKHELCESCCAINYRKDINVPNAGHIICPVEQEFTTLINGIDDVKELPKRISVGLTCDNCSKNDPLQNFWWCGDCGESVCSWCAMQNHRNHDCSAWHEERIVHECLQQFSPFPKFSTENAEKEIDQFCEKLATELKNRLSIFEEAVVFNDSVNRVFGKKSIATSIPNIGNQQKPTAKTLKKLNLLNMVLSSVDKNLAFDVERLIELFQMKNAKVFYFPSVEFVADLFFQNANAEKRYRNIIPAVTASTASISTDITSGHKQLNSHSPASSTPLEKKPQVSYASVAKSEPVLHQVLPLQIPIAEKKTAELTWNTYLKDGFKNPSKLCAIPNVGVVVLDDLGVHLLSDALCYRKYKGWPCPPSPSSYSIPTVTYHAGHDSIFVLREVYNNRHFDAKKIIELKIPELIRSSAVAYPDFLDQDNRLLGTSKSGNLICASSSIIWIKILDPPKREAIVWRRGLTEKFESFTELIVGPLIDASTESLYFMGSKTVYIFSYTYGASCRMVQSISVLEPPIMMFKNIVFASKNDQTAMVPVSSNQHTPCLKIQPLNHTSVKNIAMSSDDAFVYLLNCDTNNIYVGKVRIT